MNPYRERFGSIPRLFVVVHVVTQDQTLHNVDLALSEGADGVFLIYHIDHTSDKLMAIYGGVRKEHPNAWIGLNLLSARTADIAACQLPEGVDGLWSDNPGIREGSNQQPVSDQTKYWLGGRKKTVIHFGGVAFKGQAQPEDLVAMTQLAARHLDVVTTSGSRTGSPAEMQKIKTMGKALNQLDERLPLALASGVDKSNIYDYFLHSVNAFLVASSITDDEELIRPGAVKRLLLAIGR